MAALLELLIIPVVALGAIIISALWSNLDEASSSDSNDSPMLVGALLLGLLLISAGMLLRLEWMSDESEAIFKATEIPSAPQYGTSGNSSGSRIVSSPGIDPVQASEPRKP